jgi:Ricin-type beta-trefoil lectin domain-like
MSTSYFIKSRLSGNVIDIQGNSTQSGALLDAYPQKSRLADNQLWEFVADPAGSGYYFIQSKLSGYVIDIKGATKLPLSTLPRSLAVGAHLEVSPQKAHVADSQLWEFVVDPAGSGYFLIVNKLNGYVIDIEGASSSAGALLDAYPWKFTGYDNQLWAVVDGNFPTVVETVPVPAGCYHGYGNYILANGSNCATLTGIRATIILTEDRFGNHKPSTRDFQFS